MLFDLLENCTKPTIAAINGFKLGRVEPAMSCHIRVVSKCKMGLPEVSLGVIPRYEALKDLKSCWKRKA